MKKQNVIAVSIALALGTYLASAVITTNVAQAAGFSVMSLKGSYGCLGTLGTVSPSSSAISELIQLNLDGKGAASGSMRLFLNGEECDGTLASGSAYTLNADGTGNLLLTVTFSSDPDADMTCGGLLKTVFAPEKLAILLQENGEHFAMVGSDDFFSAASDNGDITLGNFTGSCVSQTHS